MQHVTTPSFMCLENISVACGAKISRSAALEMLVYGVSVKPFLAFLAVHGWQLTPLLLPVCAPAIQLLTALNPAM